MPDAEDYEEKSSRLYLLLFFYDVLVQRILIRLL